MNLTTVAGVTEAITKLIAQPPKDKPSPQMLTALSAVVKLVEGRYSSNASVTEAMKKIRAAYNLKPEADSQSINGG